MEKRVMNVKEAAIYIGVSRDYVYKLVRRKKIPCYVPFDGRIYFKRDEIEEFLFRNKQPADYENFGKLSNETPENVKITK
jgi:excisionase family DNA binding protein